MKEKELLEKLASKWGIPAKAAKVFVDDYHAEIQDALKKNGEVTLNDMGKYVVQNKPAREARNPMTGETVKVPAKTVAKWRPNKKFKDSVLAGTPKKK